MKHEPTVAPNQSSADRLAIRNGVRAVLTRIEDAHTRFEKTLTELAPGLTLEQARAAKNVMLHLRVAKLDASADAIRVVHGAFLDPDAIRRAAEFKISRTGRRRKAKSPHA